MSTTIEEELEKLLELHSAYHNCMNEASGGMDEGFCTKTAKDYEPALEKFKERLRAKEEKLKIVIERIDGCVSDVTKSLEDGTSIEDEHDMVNFLKEEGEA